MRLAPIPSIRLYERVLCSWMSHRLNIYAHQAITHKYVVTVSTMINSFSVIDFDFY